MGVTGGLSVLSTISDIQVVGSTKKQMVCSKSGFFSGLMMEEETGGPGGKRPVENSGILSFTSSLVGDLYARMRST
jgi:hypothetical protein